MADQGERPVFREVQPLRRVWWVAIVVAGIALIAWWGLVQQVVLGQPFGSNPGPDWAVWLVWLLSGVGFPAAFWVMRLIVEVRHDGVHIRYAPLMRRHIPLAEIERWEARTYQPIAEYGGWGIKGWKRDRISYSVSGNVGVGLTLRDGCQVMLGSQRADELAAAIAEAAGPARGAGIGPTPSPDNTAGQ